MPSINAVFVFMNTRSPNLCYFLMNFNRRFIFCNIKTNTSIHFRAEGCQKYWLYQKMIQIKVVENSISCKKLTGRVCLSPPPPRVELWGSKDWLVSNILMYWNGKSRFTLWLNTAKNTDYMKKMFQIKVLAHEISYKNLNGRTYLSPPRLELGAPKIAMFEIYYNVLKQKRRFTLRFNNIKNTDYTNFCWKRFLI